MAAQIVSDHDVAGLKLGHEHLVDIGLKGEPVVGAVDGRAIVLPPGHRLEVDFGTHVLNRPDLYNGGETGIRTFFCKPITKTADKAVRYGLKAFDRGRGTLDDILLLPRSRAELR